MIIPWQTISYAHWAVVWPSRITNSKTRVARSIRILHKKHSFDVHDFKSFIFKPAQIWQCCQAASCLELQQSAAASVKEAKAGVDTKRRKQPFLLDICGISMNLQDVFQGGVLILSFGWFGYVTNPLLVLHSQAHGGTMSGLTQKLASLGAYGRYPNNIERDLFRVLELPISPYYVELPTRSQSNREDVILTRVPMLLPHELYHYLYDPWGTI